MNREWLALHCDFGECIAQMTDQEAGEFIKAFFAVRNGKEVPEKVSTTCRVALAAALVDSDVCYEELTEV